MKLHTGVRGGYKYVEGSYHPGDLPSGRCPGLCKKEGMKYTGRSQSVCVKYGEYPCAFKTFRCQCA
jgi:hypothetical protein